MSSNCSSASSGPTASRAATRDLASRRDYSNSLELCSVRLTAFFIAERDSDSISSTTSLLGRAETTSCCCLAAGLVGRYAAVSGSAAASSNCFATLYEGTWPAEVATAKRKSRSKA